MRTTPLLRYRLDLLTRDQLLKGAWRGTHADYRSTIDGKRYVLYREGGSGTSLVPISSLPEAELIDRYLSGTRRELQRRAKASDLDLFELNPDDTERSILWADEEVLSHPRGRWELEYVQPSHFDVDELLRARKFAQVVATLNPEASSRELLSLLRDPGTYREWEELERSGSVERDESGDLVFNFADPPDSLTVRDDSSTVVVTDAVAATPDDLSAAGLDPDDYYLYFRAVPPGRGGHRLYLMQDIVNRRGLARKAELTGRSHGR